MPSSKKVSSITIGERAIGPGRPVYIVAELSANHNQSFEKAAAIIETARECGADAVKLQTYTADTITIDCDKPHFQIGPGNTWAGQTLHQLYTQATTPWEWQPRLQKVAEGCGLGFFSTPFDFSAVDFLETMGVPAYKVASFEIIDIPLLRHIAWLGKPMILSTGGSCREEIEEAVRTIRECGNHQIVLLKCTSSYPAPPEEMNLKTIPDMAATFGVPCGLSDHTMGSETAIAAVALGAVMIEKHLILSRADGGPDAGFSMEPKEFADLVRRVRLAEKALGGVRYEPTDHELANLPFRRSLFVVKDVKAGERVSPENVRSIRPGQGLHPRHYDEVMNRKFVKDVVRGTPLYFALMTPEENR